MTGAGGAGNGTGGLGLARIDKELMLHGGQLIPGIGNLGPPFGHETGLNTFERLRSSVLGGRTMNDVSLIMTLSGFFLLSALYVRLCGGL